MGSIIALTITDRIGRLRTWQAFVVLWMSGSLMVTFSSGILGLLLFARIWSGLGAGGLTVVAPLFLSEVAPARSRGRIVSTYMVVLLSFLMFGLFFYLGLSTPVILADIGTPQDFLSISAPKRHCRRTEINIVLSWACP